MQKPTITEGHPGYTYPVIPGPPCYHCKSTGWTMMHGMPRNTRNGARFFDHGCSECGRDPTKYLMAEIARKTSSPND